MWSVGPLSWAREPGIEACGFKGFGTVRKAWYVEGAEAWVHPCVSPFGRRALAVRLRAAEAKPLSINLKHTGQGASFLPQRVQSECRYGSRPPKPYHIQSAGP